jgi:hypothetical protein
VCDYYCSVCVYYLLCLLCVDPPGVSFAPIYISSSSPQSERINLCQSDLIVGIGPRGSDSFTLGCGGGSIDSGKRSKTLPTGVFRRLGPGGGVFWLRSDAF